MPPGVLGTLSRRNFQSRSHDKGKVHSLKGTHSFAVNFATQNLTPTRGISLSLSLAQDEKHFFQIFLSLFFFFF